MNNGSGMIQNALRFMQGYGMNGEQAVRMMCQQRGVDFDSFMQTVKSEYGK